MAKPPSKRRGITLGPRADSAASLNLLHITPSASVSPTSDRTRGAAETADGKPGSTPAAMPEQLAQLRRLNADLDIRWRRQAEHLQTQLQQLEQQRDQIALQRHQLQALAQKRQTSGRLGILLALLALAGTAALGFHIWPKLQEVDGDLSRVSANVGQLAPQLQAARRQVTSLSLDMGQIGSAVASLRNDVSSVRADLGSLRQTVDTPKNNGVVQVDARGRRGAAPTLPRNATTMTNPYRAMRPLLPW